jgi:hypothetical protein
MRGVGRKSAPKVKGGQVQKKNNWALTPHYSQTTEREIRVDRQRPGRGYRHLLSKADVERFIALLPDWGELSVGLDAIVLAPGERDTEGFHYKGVVAVCAWDAGLWVSYHPSHFDEHAWVFERLGVPHRRSKGVVELQWTEETARAYQLLHVLLHELGHHRDRMTTRSQSTAARGEPFAEAYARRFFEEIYDRYQAVFAR